MSEICAPWCVLTFPWPERVTWPRPVSREPAGLPCPVQGAARSCGRGRECRTERWSMSRTYLYSHRTRCVCMCVCVCVCVSVRAHKCTRSVDKSCPTLCDPMDCRPPGSSVHAISKARVREWGAISSPRGLPDLEIKSAVSCIAGGFVPLHHLISPHDEIFFLKKKPAKNQEPATFYCG